jgi:glycosyltransferase involved in cell wall biosynthesis
MNNKISIITAVFNGQKTLERMIKSIVVQDDPDIELLIIDGGSTDETSRIISKYSNFITYYISEPDKGIYDAWNKGISFATGRWIMFLGCDDILLPDAVKNYREFLATLSDEESFDLISSRLEMIDVNDKVIRVKGWSWEWPKYLKEVTIAHPGALHSSNLFKRYGLYDIKYKIVGDFELILRPRNNLKAAFMNKITVKMSEGGTSDSFKAILEHYQASTSTGGYPKLKGKVNVAVVFTKLTLKRFARYLGLNIYLNK